VSPMGWKKCKSTNLDFMYLLNENDARATTWVIIKVFESPKMKMKQGRSCGKKYVFASLQRWKQGKCVHVVENQGLQFNETKNRQAPEAITCSMVSY